MSAAALILVEDVVSGYEPGVPIVAGVSMRVAAGEVVAVLGPNGAGKSTLLKTVAGLVPISSGRVLCQGEDLRRCAVHERARKGIAYVPQTQNVFAGLSVLDNLKIALQLLPAARRDPAMATLGSVFPDLFARRSTLAGRLSGGQRQMLAVARALLVAPKVLLLDEPSAGLAPKAVAELFDKLKEISRAHIAILLVEQNVRAALSIADRAYVLVEGRNRCEGAARDLSEDPQIGALYLGAERYEPARGVQ